MSFKIFVLAVIKCVTILSHHVTIFSRYVKKTRQFPAERLDGRCCKVVIIVLNTTTTFKTAGAKVNFFFGFESINV